MNPPEQLFPIIQQKENGGNIQNGQEQNNNLENYDEQHLIELAIKQSLEQEDLEIERDREEQLIQLAILNSMEEINSKKIIKDDNIMKLNEEKEKEKEKEEEKFDENFGICPINLEYMKHPMLSPSGNYYEKSTIIEWINKNQTDPMTREKLTVDMLVEDKEYSKKIKEYKKKFKKEIQKLNK